MNINELKIKYANALPYEVQFCEISHVTPHYHEKELELIFCLKGSINLVAGHQKVKVNAGEIFSIDFRDIHYLYSKENNFVLIFHLDLTKLHIPWEELSYLYFTCESSHCYPYQKQAMSFIKDIIFTLAYFKYCNLPGNAQIANSLLDILIKYFNYFNYENQTEQFNAEMHDRFYRILKYCTENYNKKITLTQLAEMEHISRTYISQFMNNTVFLTFNNMMKYIRCYESEHLLLNTNLPVSEISYACGFSDPKYYYSAFKKWYHSTPMEHRLRYKKCLKEIEKIKFINKHYAKELLHEYITRWHIEKTLKL